MCSSLGVYFHGVFFILCILMTSLFYRPVEENRTFQSLGEGTFHRSRRIQDRRMYASFEFIGAWAGCGFLLVVTRVCVEPPFSVLEPGGCL